MAVPTKDPILADHLAWLGYVQPEGLVVSAPALVDSQVVIDRAALPDVQRRLADHVSSLALTDSDTGDTAAGIVDLPRFLTEFLGWPADLLVGWDVARPLPAELAVSLPEFGETLAPTYAVTQPRPKEGASPWLLLVQSQPTTVNLDKPAASHERGWAASPAKKFERLLRETQVPIGLLTNGVTFRLIYAPPKENSGALTFQVAAMTEVPGRLILGAFHLLLNSWTLFTAPSTQRLPAVLQTSRDYQASVSEKLAEQVLHALYELLRGFEAADSQARTKLLRDLAAQHPESIYGGLVTVLLRLVFVLFAEDRGLLPMGGLYVRHYSVRGLFERLRADAERHPDTMDQRFGAWAQLLALFRLIHGGCQHAELNMPAREGHLFDPERFPFLEGRSRQGEPVAALPLVSDGVLLRILEKLCILDGERVSYRTLDVEEIGSVYQTIMGFGVEVVAGVAVAFKGKRKKGAVPAAPVLDLEALLALKPADRLKSLVEEADTKLTGEAEKRVKEAVTVDDLLAALEKRIDRNSTPSPVAKGGLALQPNDERRRSGSHYTPRSFTEPIVRKTLAPVLARLGDPPTPQQVLDLKIADIAVGSAAFLVEVCRQLGDILLRAWRVHGGRPPLPPDETEELLAMRTVAQRCLYGVDRNAMAVDLAKLSLWLVTLAKDHPFTFLDHSIRCGDSVVGLSQKQIAAFTWELNTAGKQRILGQDRLERQIERATEKRREILEGGDLILPALKAQLLRNADEALDEARFVGDLIVAAYFSADKDRARREKLEELRDRCVAWHTSKPFDPTLKPSDVVNALRVGPKGVLSFHWSIEFPEVFGRENGGFDAIVGNPPFAGKNTLLAGNRDGYVDWLKALHEESHGNADLVAHFFRRAFNILRHDGTFGLIATNTIRQGDTRQSGLRWICVRGGGTIYAARRRHKWAGAAAVVVSVVWVVKGAMPAPFDLDGKSAPIITAYLFHDGGHENPAVLLANAGRSFIGSYVLGMGFTFDDTDKKGVTNPVAEMERLITKDPHNAERIFPYIGGEEVNDSPTHAHNRYVINFADFPLRREKIDDKSWLRADEKQRDVWLRTGIVPEDYPEPVAADWPDLRSIVEQMVKPGRDKDNRDGYRRYWWQYAEKRVELSKTTEGLPRVLVVARVGQQGAFAFLPARTVFSEQLVVFAFDVDEAFVVLQCRVHEVWARFFASSMKDDLRYTPSDCFETFPFPSGWETDSALKVAGREYYEARAALMVRHNEGLTTTYNRFHDPTEDNLGILRLRELHAVLDSAVLAAYGWSDLPTACEFIPDYQEVNADGEPVAKSIRYRWSDAVRDEVLARLLKLNAERAMQESHTGVAAVAPMAAKKPRTAKGKKTTDGSGYLFAAAAAVPLPAVAPASRDGWRDRIFVVPVASRHGELAADLYTRHWIYAALQLAPGGLSAAQLINGFRLLLSRDGRSAAALSGDADGKKWAKTYRQTLALSDLLGSLLNRARDGELTVHNVDGEAHLRLNAQWRQTPSDWLFTDAEIVLRAQEDAALKLALLPFETSQPDITLCLSELLRSAV